MAQDVNIKINVDTNQAQQSTTNYRKTLKDLQAQMVELEVSTNGLSEATAEQRARYAELEAQSGKIADAIGDVSARINANANDYQNFNAALEGLKGGAAAVQGLVGTLDLLGVSNSGVENVVKTLMSLQGVMNSINTIQQIFNKDSKLRIALQKLLTVEVKKTAVAEGEATVAAGALAAGEDAATTASFTLAGACKAVGTAIKSIPVIGWILAAVAALGTLIGLIASANEQSAEGLKQQIEAEEHYERAKTYYENVSSKLEDIKVKFASSNGILETADKNSKLFKDTLKELGDQLGVDLTNTQIDMKAINLLQEAYIKMKDKQLQLEYIQNQVVDARNKLQKINNALTAAASMDHKSRAEFLKNELELEDDVAKEMARTIHLAKDSGRSVTTMLDAQVETLDKGYGTKAQKKLGAFWKSATDAVTYYDGQVKDAVDGVVEANKQYNDEIDKLGLKRVASANSTTTTIKETEDKHLDNVIKSNEKALEKIKKYQDAYNDDIDKRNSETHQGRLDNLLIEKNEILGTLDNELEDYKTYYNSLSDEDKKALGDKLLTIEQFEAEQQKVRDVALANYKKNVEKENDKEAAKKLANQYEIEAKEQEVARIRGRIAGLQEGTPEYFDALIEEAEAQRDLELEQLEQDKEAKLLSEEDYQIRKKEIMDKYNTDNYEAAKVAAEKEIKVKEDSLNVIGSMIQNLNTFTNQLMEIELESVGDNEKKKKEVRKKYATAQAMMNIAQIAIDQAMAAIGVWASVSDIPFPGNVIAGAVLSALVAAVGIASTVQAIQNKNKIMKAARGAYIVGPSHSQGGVLMEVEGGEAILNKRAMSIPAYRNMASAMNVATGGVAFPGTNPNMGMTASIDESVIDRIVNKIAAIPVVVSEQSITNAQRKVGVIEGRSRF